MADIHSVISLDVNDAPFARFKELFDKYQQQLARTPGLWAKATKEQAATAKNFERMTAAMMSVQHINREAVEAGARMNVQLGKTQSLWSSIASSSRSTLGNILSAGEGLLKWTGIFGAVGGLMGIGGIFGLDRLAARTGDARRTATGLGMSIGGYRAFGIDFSRFLDPDAFLGNVNQMETDVTKQTPAYALLGHGLTGNTTADAVAMFNAMRGLAQRTPTNLLATTFGAYGLDTDPATLRRLQSMPQSEVNQQLAAFAKDKDQLNIRDKIAKDWTDLDTQLSRAGAQISKVFVDSLDPLVPKLEDLSKKFVQAVAAFAKSGAIKTAIDEIAKALGWLAGLAGKFDRAMQVYDNINQTFENLPNAADTGATVGGWLSSFKSWLMPDAAGVTANTQSYKDYLWRLDQYFGLPRQALESVFQSESGGAMYPPNNPTSSAAGPFQWLAKSAANPGFGIQSFDPHDPLAAANATGQYLSALDARYGGNIAQAIAAYHWGMANVDPIRNRKDWFSLLPTNDPQAGNVQRYVSTTLAIMNATGGSAVVAASTLGAGP